MTLTVPVLALPVRVLSLTFAGVFSLSAAAIGQNAPQGTPAPAASAPVTPAPAPVRPPRRVIPKPPTAAQSANTILLDPAHGGADLGSQIRGESEGDITLSFAQRIRTLLVAQGFTVVLAREASADKAAPDANTPTIPSEDQRTEQANRLHPLACLLLHATSGGHGVHLFASALSPVAASAEAHAIVLWNTAQAGSLTESLRLATDLSTSINGSRIPLVLGRASVPPIDSLTCPAVAVELASLTNASLTDPAYQDRVASAIVNGLTFYRGHTVTEAARVATADQAAKDAGKAATDAAQPASKPATKRLRVQPPAPVIRQEPGVDTPAVKPDAAPPAGAPQ